jgi:hypothetical protein
MSEQDNKQSTVNEEEEAGDTLAPLHHPQRRRTPSDLRYLSDDMMGSIVRRRKVSEKNFSS